MAGQSFSNTVTEEPSLVMQQYMEQHQIASAFGLGGMDLDQAVAAITLQQYAMAAPAAEHRPRKAARASTSTSWDSCANILSFGAAHAAADGGGSGAVLIKSEEEQAPSGSRRYGFSSAATTTTLWKEDVEARPAAKRSYDDTVVVVRSGEPTPNQQDHVLAERKRREKIRQRFIALSKIIPGLTKMDKASVLDDAIKYVKQLQEHLNDLEKVARRKTVEVAKLSRSKRFRLSSANIDRSSSDDLLEEGEASGRAVVPEIEAWVSESTVLIKIHCENHKGALITALSEVESMGLTIITTSVLPFATFLDITLTATAGEDFGLSVKEIVNRLIQAFKVHRLDCLDSYNHV
ncbi:hypothetical protein ACP4OV_005477 [Aristida adscensionis]